MGLTWCSPCGGWFNQTKASKVLVALAKTKNNLIKLKIVNQAGALAGIVKCLCTHEKPGLLEVVKVLANLTDTEDDAIKLRIANENGSLVGLVKCLSGTQDQALREVASRALANLARTGNNSLRTKIANEEGLLSGLVKCLPTLGKPVWQTRRARSGRVNGGLRKRRRISTEEGARVSPAQSVSEDEEPLVEQRGRSRTNRTASPSFTEQETCY